MTEVIQDFSKRVLIQAIEANIAAQTPVTARLELEGVEIYEGLDVTWSLTGLAHPLLNGVMAARFAPEDANERIKATLDVFRARDLPLSWWVGPSSRPADLGARLQAHGLVHASDATGMAVDLLTLSEAVRAPPDLVIERVADPQALEMWLRPAPVCFEFPDLCVRFFYRLFSAVGFGPDSPWLHYVGTLKGEPVACSSLFMGAGVAGVYNVGTVPEARRQGIGTAITLAPLREARERGYRVGTLHATEAGIGVYRRLGFEEYCTLSMYLWTGEQDTAP
jgi:ribosomal protein S18 acetylase RimI-like enzyme